MHTALSIGAADCSCGAGVGSDLKAFSALGVYGMAVVTSVIAWNTQGSRGHELMDDSLVANQLAAIADRDLRADQGNGRDGADDDQTAHQAPFQGLGAALVLHEPDNLLRNALHSSFPRLR